MNNKFYIKCVLIACAILLSTQCFSSSIPLLEQVTNLHKGRMALFNEDQKEAEKLGLTFKKDTKVSGVSGKTTAIRGILNDPSKVSRTTYATPDQKKYVFKALIAGYVILDSDYEAALDDLNSPKFISIGLVVIFLKIK
jgi:hypothetical protein